MSTRISRRSAACACLLATTAIASPVFAQTVPPPPVRQSIDGNGVDLFLGTMNVDAPALTIGGADNGLSYYKLMRGGSWLTDNMTARLNLSGTTMTVSLGG